MNPTRSRNPAGATLAVHETVAVTWDGRDAERKSLPDGDYFLFVEFTGQHRQGPMAIVPVRKGPESQAKSLPEQPHYKNIKVTYTPGGS